MPTLKRRNSTTPIRHDPYRYIYQSSRWHRFSKFFLQKNRLCKECAKENKVVVATESDHVIPLKIWIPQGGDPYDVTNVQPLCKPHHSKKTAAENKGWNQ